MKEDKVKKAVKKKYAKIARTNSSCCSGGCGCGGQDLSNILAEDIGYSKQEIAVAPEANLGLGCGNPTAIGDIHEGDVVLDLGSGAGFDAFLALKKVGSTGKVIGVDMTEEMIEKSTSLSEKYG